MGTDFNIEADHYDLFEAKNAKLHESLNKFMIDFFHTRNIHNVLDFSCGTGAQAIPLAEAGFKITAVDIADKMLDLAREKGKHCQIKFINGDMRRSHIGIFDACISILNSTGYLSKSDFILSLKNIRENLKPGGYFIFDNTNRGYIDSGHLMTHELIDTVAEINSKKLVRFVTANYDKSKGIVTWDWRVAVQEGCAPIIQSSGKWIRQTYSKVELKDILSKQGFTLESIYDRTLIEFNESNSFAFFSIAKRA